MVWRLDRLARSVARRLAERHGIDADGLVGTGPDGRVTKEDMQRAIESGAPAAAAGASEDGVARVPLTGIRRTAAERLFRIRSRRGEQSYRRCVLRYRLASFFR